LGFMNVIWFFKILQSLFRTLYRKQAPWAFHKIFMLFSLQRLCFSEQFWRIVVVCPIRFNSCVWCFLSPAHD
jgi:hypothetical protein